MTGADIAYARYDRIRPIRWTGGALELLDQRRLPFETTYVSCGTSDEVADAIRQLVVRGAPAIGIAAAASRWPPRYFSPMLPSVRQRG